LNWIANLILVIDNYDSFVHNLARYVREAGQQTLVIRNDAASAADCVAMEPDAVIISPGPNRPADAGVSMALLQALPAATPLLGVCLGHQCLVEAFGGQTRRARHPLHGEAGMIFHQGQGILKGLPEPAPVARYHSLISVLPKRSRLEAIAWSKEDELMAVRCLDQPWFGVQFHPESVLTPSGRVIVKNFLDLVKEKSEE